MHSTSLQDRVTVLELAQAGLTDNAIAQRLGWHLATVRKWRRRGQQHGRPGLVSRVGRPVTGALSSFSAPVRETLQTWRQQHPGWGPDTLLAEAGQADDLAGHRLPKRATLAHWLKEQRLTRSYQRHRELPQPPADAPQAAHAAWEMDAYGTVCVPGVGMISLINLNDCFSRVKLLSFPCWVGDQQVTRHPDTPDYLLVLRLAFLRWGLPGQLRVDRDSIFFDNTSKSPFPTQLHLFLLGLNVDLLIGPPHQPRKRAITERSHQTWDQQVLTGQRFADWDALWRALEARRDFLNHDLACRGSDNLPPLIAHPQAATPRRPYSPAQEPTVFDVERIATYLSQGQWFRKASNVGVVTIGNQHYGLGQTWAKHEVQITFDPADRCLVCLHQDGQQTKRRPIKGISYAELAGEMGRLFDLHPFQLALPFSWPEQRVIRLSETLGDTT
jgi:transposase